MDFFGLFSRKSQSKNVAKDRLKLVLVHDRADCSTEVLEMLKNDIMKVLLRYMDIEQEALDIQITQTVSDSNERVPMLIANIPFKNVRPPKDEPKSYKPPAAGQKTTPKPAYKQRSKSKR